MLVVHKLCTEHAGHYADDTIIEAQCPFHNSTDYTLVYDTRAKKYKCKLCDSHGSLQGLWKELKELEVVEV